MALCITVGPTAPLLHFKCSQEDNLSTNDWRFYCYVPLAKRRGLMDWELEVVAVGFPFPVPTAVAVAVVVGPPAVGVVE